MHPLEFNRIIRRLSAKSWTLPGLPAVAKDYFNNTITEVENWRHQAEGEKAPRVFYRTGEFNPHRDDLKELTIVPRAELLAGQVQFGGAA